MEDVYTIRIKTKPDTRNLYPSERRYSASTVSGLAWVHIALAATSFLLACLALVNPTLDVTESANSTQTFDNITTNENDTETSNAPTSGYILVLAPSLITVFGLASGITSILASVRWYIDRNITWLFVVSCLSTVVSFTSLLMVAVWFINTTEGDITEFYKDKVPFKDILVIKHTDVIDKNESHLIVALNQTGDEEEPSYLFTKRVLSINILIAAFLELLWSILSVKISYKGMRNNYKDDGGERRGNCISVVTTIKGNDPKNLPRNGKLPKPDLIEHYPSKKIKRVFLAQNENFYLNKNQNGKAKNTETSSEFYKERMINFLNKCASMEEVSNPERTPSVQSEAVLNTIPEVTNVEVNVERTPGKDRVTPVSWGDSPDHTVYNQNNINFDKIFNFTRKTDKESEKCDGASENVQNN
ncbi:unnamed protein product [Diatraea saccharalis]|uniref:Uncharacterized protein n=1 Tax=Diatraea saccharalis TaxID=40085 RepID=A0A9N9WJL3_9NEOP|nr:unnamed protein product [Diatraea saccharalis]